MAVDLLRREHKLLVVYWQTNLPGCRAVHVTEFINGEPHSGVVVHVLEHDHSRWQGLVLYPIKLIQLLHQLKKLSERFSKN